MHVDLSVLIDRLYEKRIARFDLCFRCSQMPEDHLSGRAIQIATCRCMKTYFPINTNKVSLGSSDDSDQPGPSAESDQILRYN